MRDKAHMLLALAGAIYFLAVFGQGITRVWGVSENLAHVEEMAAEFADASPPEHTHLDRNDTLGQFRRCMDHHENSMNLLGALTVLQFRVMQAAAWESTVGSGIGVSVCFVLLLLGRWRALDS